MRKAGPFRAVYLEFEALWQQVLLPLLLVLLPWRSWLSVVKRFTPGSITKPERLACKQPQQELNFPWQCYTHQLLDRADFFLSVCRSSSWRQKQVSYLGPQMQAAQSPAIFFTFHYGQGFWALEYLKLAGYRIAWLHAPVAANREPGMIISNMMGNQRIKLVSKLSGDAAIPTGNSIASMEHQLLVERRSVLIMPDAPIRPEQSTLPVNLLGENARMAAGAIKLACRMDLPKYIYTIAADLESGKRCMHMYGPFYDKEPDILAGRLGDILTTAVEKQPSAWHVWPFADGFFTRK